MSDFPHDARKERFKGEIFADGHLDHFPPGDLLKTGRASDASDAKALRRWTSRNVVEARARFSEMTSGNKVSTMVEDVNSLQHSPKFSLLCRLGVPQGYGAQQIIRGFG